MTAHSLQDATTFIKELALSQGFMACGISKARNWMKRRENLNYGSSMDIKAV